MEFLSLQQSWQQVHGYSLPVKSRIPSWSLIASICSESQEIGFLPDFLAKKCDLHPVMWQPSLIDYIVKNFLTSAVCLQFYSENVKMRLKITFEL